MGISPSRKINSLLIALGVKGEKNCQSLDSKIRKKDEMAVRPTGVKPSRSLDDSKLRQVHGGGTRQDLRGNPERESPD